MSRPGLPTKAAHALSEWVLFRLAGRIGLALAILLAVPALAFPQRWRLLTVGSLLLLVALVAALPRAAVRRLSTSEAAIGQLHEENRRQSEAAQHERRELSAWVADQVARDRLTGLLNRTAFVEHLASVLDRTDDEACRAVIVVDIAGFAAFNEAHGTTASDEMLVAVGARLASVLRPEDTVARLDGDVFGALLQTVPRDLVQHVVERVYRAVASTYSIGGNVHTVAAVCGVVSLDPTDTIAAADVLGRAQIAMQNAKATARPVVLFEPRLEAETRKRLSFYEDIGQALAADEFSLAYQPVVRACDGEVAGVEALMRWTHAERGPISPAEFIPIAEASGQIVDMGLWALRTACRQQRAWRKAHEIDLVMAVNLSARQIRDPEAVDRIADVITRETIDPRTVKLEITESLIVEDDQAAIEVLQRLRSLGVRLSVDDFGTGYSSLSRLSKLPIHELKIDRYFVAGIGCEGPRETILTASIGMAHGLGLDVVAEGVETQEQLDYLLAQGCDYIQGFLYSQPIPAEQIIPFTRAVPTIERLPRQRTTDAGSATPPTPSIPTVMPSVERHHGRRLFR